MKELYNNFELHFMYTALPASLTVLSDNRFFFFKSSVISPNKQSQNANLSQVCTIISSYTVCVSLICLILIDLSSTFKFYDYNRIVRNIVTFPKSKL
jgi:hypothetical protein